MKIINNRYKQVIDFDFFNNYVLAIENSYEYLKVLQEIFNETNGIENSDFVLSDNGETLKFSKAAIFIYDYLNLDINNRKIINEINLTRFPIDYMERITPHCFRHTFATRCFESGIDFKIIQKYLGHASLKMTADLYVHITDTLAGDELPKLEDKLDMIEGMGEEITVNKIKKLQEYDSKIVPINTRITARSLA